MAEDTQAAPASAAATSTPTQEATSPAAPIVIEDHAEEVASIEHTYTEQPKEIVLTVKAKRWKLFAAKGVKVSVFQEEKELASGETDKDGQALFKLAPGTYSVKCKEQTQAVNLQQHATLTF